MSVDRLTDKHANISEYKRSFGSKKKVCYRPNYSEGVLDVISFKLNILAQNSGYQHQQQGAIFSDQFITRKQKE